ncbi:malate synthase G [Roseovarius sp. M141]|uniref:malate synthase G n=1 Tax=Roseovarius sp. M141 TaxID=2583806 RepID=UPI0020CCB266|nr:malate synthase G [Roseovarius sp. M141]MCQ0093454.1 malate synthase G [Roseovarius sp. M141]
MPRATRHTLDIDAQLVEFIEERALPGTGIYPAMFWSALAGLADDFGPRHAALLNRRADLQARIDAWHRARPGRQGTGPQYRAMLSKIGYLVPEGADFQIETRDLDPEICAVPGPQLVVPSTNARFALNAANARWSSLYDALYGTDALGSVPVGGSFDAARGRQVIGWARDFLDEAAPLESASHHDVTRYRVTDGALCAEIGADVAQLADSAQFCGYGGDVETPDMIVLRNNGLHILLDIDAAHTVGRLDRAHVADMRLESALSAIIDLEDSVAVVDGADKAIAYGTWLGLMRGDLEERFVKGGREVARRLSDDIAYTGADGRTAELKGRALLFVRNVGHLMTTPAVRDASGAEIPEGILDALTTVAIALHDINGARANSPAGSVYIVKPKMHGPDEVALADTLFAAVEDALGLARNTVKLGIMDEERRTSANLKECIRAAKGRVAFVNTGFLDRTGDEIHTSIAAGPMLRKDDMKQAPWLAAYEARNVEIALAAGFQGRAQIGKGMWAVPDNMAEMLESKIAHPLAGANCAWVPSPTAATLHATHYHRVDVIAQQNAIVQTDRNDSLAALLTPPLAESGDWSADQIAAELDNNVQGILGYVVRWVDNGIGCSKVPDIDDVGQMEDRATCRISAQHVANWLRHGIVTRDDVEAALARMAAVVDRQNADDPSYLPMAGGDSLAFHAAADLIFEGAGQPSGYTEPLLHAYRLTRKETTGKLRRAAS